jgi:hypothetical protein
MVGSRAADLPLLRSEGVQRCRVLLASSLWPNCVPLVGLAEVKSLMFTS